MAPFPLLRHSGRAVRAVALALAVSCGKDSTPPLVATSIATSVSSITLDALGATQQFSVTVRDQNGAPMAAATASVSSSAPGVATAAGATSITVTAVANGTAVVSVSAGNATAAVTVLVAQAPQAPTRSSGDGQSGTVGKALGVAVRVKVQDRLGNPIAGNGVTFGAAPGGGSASPVNATTASDGTASTTWTLGTAIGTHVLQAVAAGVKDTVYFTATALAAPAALLVITAGNNQTAGAGNAVPVLPAVRVVDAYGNAVAGATVTFAVATGGGAVTGGTATSNASGVATVGSWVLGSAFGANSLTAGAAGLSSVTFNATAAAAPTITSVATQPLIPGSAFVVTGSGFSPTVGGNSIRVGGVTAAITAASSTLLTATVPCVATGSVPVVVTSNGASSAAVTATLTGSARALAVGQAFVAASNAASLCNELPATGGTARYLISVYSTSTSANTLVDFELGGNPSAGAAGARQYAPLRASRAALVAPSEDTERDATHLAHLERERALVEALRARDRAAPAATRPLTAAAVAPPSVGDRRVFSWSYSSCSDTSTHITARVLYAGSKAIVWEDSSNTINSTNNAVLADRYQRIGQVFDADQYDVVRTTFGDPLRRDALTDNDGRVHMLFTHRVNDITGGGVAAFVTSADQYSRNSCATSNVGEFFYGSVPTSGNSGLESTAYPDGWYNFMGRTVVHEVKHIASMAARVANNAPFEASWLEEGTARHAEEVWARGALHHTAFAGNNGYGTAAANGVFCDFNSSNATCLANDALRRPSWGVRRPFNELRPRLLEPWNWSPFGDGTGQSPGVFYQTAWSLVRFAVDRYGASDAAFLTALINSSSTSTANVAAVAGVPFDQIVGQWSLALYADDYPGLTNASNDIQFRTWNLRDIYGALHSDPLWASRFATTYPIQPTALSFGAFTAQQLGVRGGANAYFELSGAAASTQLLSLRGIGGAAASTLLRIAIARLQ